MKKRGQMQISFGMIFSIILIIFFLAFAFYAIKMFLGASDTSKIEKFREDLQGDINNLWSDSAGTQNVGYSVPKKVEMICFKDWEYENLIFEPSDAVEGISPKNMEHLDIIKTTQNENPLCFENNGKIEFVLKKGFGEDLVFIEKKI